MPFSTLFLERLWDRADHNKSMKNLFRLLFIACFAIFVSCESPAPTDPTDPENPENPVDPVDPNQPTKSVWSKRTNCGMSMEGVRGYQIGDEICYRSSDILWAYNYKTDKWAQKAAIPPSMSLTYDGEFTLNNKFYVVEKNQNKILEYEPKTNVWSESTISNIRDGGQLVYSNGPYFMLNGIVYGTDYKYNEQKNIWERYGSLLTFSLKNAFVSIGNNCYQISRDKSGNWFLLEFNPAIKESWVTKLQIDVGQGNLGLLSYIYFADKKNIRVNCIYTNVWGRETEHSYLINLTTNSCHLDRVSNLAIDKFTHNLYSSVTTTDGRVFIGHYNASYYEYVP